MLQKTSFDWDMQCWVLGLLICLALIETWWCSICIRAYVVASLWSLHQSCSEALICGGLAFTPRPAGT